jgi:hypothetical protein
VLPDLARQSTSPAKNELSMIKKLALILLAIAAATGPGCCMCDHCDDYAGSYYGGITGAHDLESGRAASAYSGSSTPAPPMLVEHE